jgi:dCTP deaminase
MILSDFDLSSAIKGRRLIIEPFEQELVRENGIDLRLDDEVARHVVGDKDFVMDPSNEEHIKKSYKLEKKVTEIILDPKEQVLLTTYEQMEVPDDLMGFVELRSTWARHGLSMPPTIIDAGFVGNITLEVINNSPYKIKLRPMQRFAHIIFAKTSSRVNNVYSGQYKGQKGVRLPKVLKL